MPIVALPLWCYEEEKETKMSKLYTVIDAGYAVRHGEPVRLLGTMTREAALAEAAECGGKEITEGPEKGLIHLDDEGWTWAVPHDLPTYISPTSEED
jgi:hypothetical protein